jgi:L-fuculose-phosphate aldolase
MESGYSGIKFENTILGCELPEDDRLEELKYWCRVFHEKGLAPPYEGGSYGNLSFRVSEKDESFVITASQSSLGLTEDDRFVTVPKVDLEKEIVYSMGKRMPSSESMLHYAVYRQRPDVMAVFHGHSSDISRKACVPVSAREEPYGSIELVQSVLEVLDGNHFIQMKNHGFLALGETIEEAGKSAVYFLEKCRQM